MDEAIVSYFAIGEASCILPMVRALEFEELLGAGILLQRPYCARFFHLQATLTRSFELKRSQNWD